jgi:hypothetical protein
VIDLTHEQPLPLSEAARRLPPYRGKATHLSTVLRWVLTGARGPAGEKIRLEAIRLGGRWLTSAEALQRFAERLTPNLHPAPTPAPRTPTARRRASEQAAKKLEALGI